MARLPFDCARCHGYINMNNRLMSCLARDTCRRYLDRKDIGERTPFIITEGESNEKCELYWENTEEHHGRTDD